MNTYSVRRVLILLVLLAFAAQPLVGALAEPVAEESEPVEIWAEACEPAAEEAGDFLMQPEAGEPIGALIDLQAVPAEAENAAGALIDPQAEAADAADEDIILIEGAEANGQEAGGESAEPSGAEADDAKATADDPAAVEGYETRRFTETIAAGGETWKDVNLVRAAGFEGPLARVTGKLTLDNVLIEGAPAHSVNLLDYFELAPGAGIACGKPEGLSISFSALSLNKGSSATLTLKWRGRKLDNKRAKWASSNARLVKVSRGKITALRAGSAYIGARFGGELVFCRLDLTGFVYAKSVRLSKKKLTLPLFNGARLAAKVSPTNTTDKTVTWASSRPDVVSVDEAGNIAGLAPGTATIVAATVNGKKAACKVTVKAIMPRAIAFQKLYVTLHPGESFQSVAVMGPAGNSYPQILYSSSDPGVATVDELGVITAVGTGTATITASAAIRDSVADTCKVCVIEPGAPRLAGVVIGINPGHQRRVISKRYPMAPGSRSTGYGVKVGATGRSTRQCEYQVVLQIGLKLKRILEEQGAEVYITRTSNDVMLTNIDRARMLNGYNVDVALQLHNNSCSNYSKTGVSAYYKTTDRWVSENALLAKLLSLSISAATGFRNLGTVKYNNFMSLNWTTTPSVLLEMGYLSNSSDDHKLARDDFRELLAQGIYEGLCTYFGR